MTRELAELILKLKDEQGLSFEKVKNTIDAEGAFVKKGIPLTTAKHAYALDSKNGLDSDPSSAELISYKVKHDLLKTRVRE